MTKYEELEVRLWSAIMNSNKDELSYFMDENTIWISGGFQMDGSEFIQAIEEISIKDFVIEHSIPVIATEDIHQLSYTIRLYSDDPDEVDFSGKMIVTATWSGKHLDYLMMTPSAI